MAYIVKRTYTRKNTSVPFFEEKEKAIVDKANAYISKNYKNTGKLLNELFEYSADRLTMTNTLIFANEASGVQLRNDSNLQQYFLARKKHCDANGISIAREILSV